MSKFVVSFVSLGDNELEIKIVNATSWKDALSKAYPSLMYCHMLPNDIETAKNRLFDQDFLFNVLEIKD